MSIQVISKAAKYGRVPVSLLFREGATGDECRLYAYLTTFDFKHRGECWPGRELGARDLGWSLRKLDGVLALLDQHKAIRRIQAGNGMPARIELLADVVTDTALQDRAALPNHVDSPARSRERTSSRTREEREPTRRRLDDEIPPCPLSACDGRGFIDTPRGAKECECRRMKTTA